ncbi:MAG: hypothetical protein V3V00_04600 [Saprospiraceae bacterium]
MENSIDPRRWSKAMRISIAAHLLLILISWQVTLNQDPDKTIDTQYAVTVSFQEIELKNTKSSNSTKSSASEGKQRPKEREVKKIEKPTPIKVPVPKPTTKPTPKPTEAPKPEPTDPVYSETTMEESEIEAIEEEIIVDEPEPEYIPESDPDPEPTEEEVFVSNPDFPSIEDVLDDIDVADDPEETTTVDIPTEEPGTNDTDSTTDGTGDSDPSLKDGESGGTGKGNEGSGKGNDEGGNDNDSGIGTGDSGAGEFDASGDGIFGRKVLFRDPSMIAYVSGQSGKIVFKVCISRSGKVSVVQIDEAGTTIKDMTTLRKALDAMSNYKYEADLTAPREQCGSFTVSIDNYQGIR